MDVDVDAERGIAHVNWYGMESMAMVHVSFYISDLVLVLEDCDVM